MKTAKDLSAIIAEQWNVVKEALYKGETDEMSIEEIIRHFDFFERFNQIFEASSTELEKPINSLENLYRGVGPNEEISLDNYNRMLPNERFMTKHNRMSPPGIPFLYLGTSNKGKEYSLKTVVAELRAQNASHITICRFIHKNNKKFIDITGDPTISLGTKELNSYIEKNLFKLVDPINMNRFLTTIYFNLFNNENIFKPVDPDNCKVREQEYRPFQTLCRYIQTKGYAGIKYRSTVDKNGFNVAIFNLHDVEIVKESMEIFKPS